MTIQQAIEKAIEGGYIPFGGEYGKSKRFLNGWHLNTEEKCIQWGVAGQDDCDFQLPLSDIFLDPLFWQSLGKAMGWDKNKYIIGNWKAHWHRFIDHLVEGKEAESFFEKL